MNPRRCKEVLIAYFRIVTGGNPRRGPHQRVRLVRNDILFLILFIECCPYRGSIFPLLMIFTKSPADGNPGIDKSVNRYYTIYIYE